MSFWLLFDALLIPLEIAFDGTCPEYVRFMVELMFLIDTFFPFFLERPSTDGSFMVTDIRKIAWERVKTPISSFWLDLISIVPYERILASVVCSSEQLAEQLQLPTEWYVCL